MTTPNLALQLTDVGLRRDQTWLVRNISWSLARGTDAAVIGANGSGKSTLVRILTGYLWPTCGTVHVLGEQFGQVDLNTLRKQIKLLQTGGPFDLDPQLTLLEVVLTGLSSTLILRHEPTSTQRDAAMQILQVVGLADRSHRRYEAASNGERARAQIARALLTTPDLLLLDEPTAGLDLVGREELLELLSTLRQRMDAPELTLVTITHHTEELFVGTSEVLLLSEGRCMTSGPIEQVLTSQNLSEAYDANIEVKSSDRRYYATLKR